MTLTSPTTLFVTEASLICEDLIARCLENSTERIHGGFLTIQTDKQYEKDNP